MPRPLIAGIYAPTQVFYLSPNGRDSESTALDTTTISRHAVRLVTAGIVGLVTNGSNGEAALLTSEERSAVTKATRLALDAAGCTSAPIIAGASAPSVSGTLALCHEAAAAGADAVLLLAPALVGGEMGATGVERYFVLVADKSPLPVVIYNYPAAAGGFDFDSDILIRLAKHSNIAGTKFTCGNVGKIARVVKDLEQRVVCENTPREVKTSLEPDDEGSRPYFAFIGVADSILAAVGGAGATGGIVGAANVFPKACARVYSLAAAGRWYEARRAQQALAKADWSLTKRGVPGFKAILSHYHGYGGSPRQPITELSAEAAQELFNDINQFMLYEQSLPNAVAS